MNEPIPELALVEIEAGEVGESVLIETPVGTIRATWLGNVSNGRELAEAMQLMADLEKEKMG